KGHDYVFRVRPNTYEQGRMLAEKAGKMKYVKWATIGPNYEYGKRAWETFRDRLKELKADVQVVGEQWPALGKSDASADVGAVDGQATRRPWVRMPELDAKPGVGIIVSREYVAGEEVLPSADEVTKMRSGG